MLNKKIDSLYESVLDNTPLTKQLLNKLGFNDKEIEKLEDNKMIIKTEKDLYSFIGVNNLYGYGQYFIDNKDYKKANKCFLKCFSIDNTYKKAIYQLLFESIKTKKYEDTLIYLDAYYDLSNKKMYNLYIFLLSFVYDLKGSYLTLAKEIKLDDIVDKEDIDSIKNVKKLIYHYKFFEAIKELRTINDINNKDKILIVKILNEAFIRQVNEKRKVTNLIHLKKYEELNEYMKTLSNQHVLSTSFELVNILVDDLTYMKTNRCVLVDKNYKTNNTLDAINNKNYDLALKLHNKYLKSRNIACKTNIVYLVLEDIKDYINNYKKEDTLYLNIIKYLLLGDYQKVCIYLNQYLTEIDKTKYIHLMFNLVKIDMLKQDKTYEYSLTTLEELKDESYFIDTNKYIKMIKESINNKQSEQARLYLDIIYKYDKTLDTYTLYDILNYSLKK